MYDLIDGVSVRAEAYLIASPSVLSELFNAVDKAHVEPKWTRFTRANNSEW